MKRAIAATAYDYIVEMTAHWVEPFGVASIEAFLGEGTTDVSMLAFQKDKR